MIAITTVSCGKVGKADDAAITTDIKAKMFSEPHYGTHLLESAKSAGKFAGKSELTLALQSVVFQGKTYTVTTSDVKQSGTSRGKDSAVKIGGGAALGALIGGIAGGGKGAAIGAAVGGGAGTGVQVFTKGKQVKIPSETRLDFTLEQPFDITYLPARKSQRSTSGQQNPDQPADVPNASSDQPQSH